MTPLWERRENETAKAYAAFCIYRDLPVESRSLSLAAEKLGRSLSLLEQWSARHEWVIRVQAYEEYLRQIEQTEMEEARRQHARDEAEDWAARRSAMREQQWRASQALLAKANKMLDSVSLDAAAVRDVALLMRLAHELASNAVSESQSQSQSQEIVVRYE
jgi:hypothetical protein